MGRVWVFGDHIDTDVLAPGHLMKLSAEDLAKHCLKAVDPDFADQVAPGDAVIAGENFGLGSSREQAAMSLKILGVEAVFAKSFARIFYRNAINLGLPAFFFDHGAAFTRGDAVDLDLSSGILTHGASGKAYGFDPLPDHLMSIIEAGGLMAYLKTRNGGTRETRV